MLDQYTCQHIKNKGYQRFLAFDFGLKRTGLAFGNTLLGQGQPLQTITTANKHERLHLVKKVIKTWEPQALVVGIPLHPDGTTHDMTRSAQRFSRQLQYSFQLPIIHIDERYSSTEAKSLGYQNIDAGAAALLLEQLFTTVKRFSNL
jgi:putative Holliday junction resolvase